MKSRSRQGCCWTIGALCCACALSACRHSNGEMILPERGQKQLESIDQGAPAASETGQCGESFRAKNDSSAYQEKSTTLCAPEKPTSHLLVHDTTYPDPSLPDLLDRPKVAAEQPTPNSNSSEIIPPLAAAPAGGPQIITWPTSEPTRTEEPLVVALRYLLDNKADKAVDALKKYGKQNQELLLQLLPVMVEVSQTNFNKAGSRAYTNLAQNLERTREPLVPRAELQIDKMVYCERIRDFGRYVPLDDTHVFRPSTHEPERLGDLVQVYVELHNLASIQRPGCKGYETCVASRVDIRAVNDKHIGWGYPFGDQDRVIHSQTQRHDFYNNYSFYVPHIPAGRYILTIHITDCLTQRSTQRSLPFMVAPLPPSRVVSAR